MLLPRKTFFNRSFLFDFLIWSRKMCYGQKSNSAHCLAISVCETRERRTKNLFNKMADRIKLLLKKKTACAFIAFIWTAKRKSGLCRKEGYQRAVYVYILDTCTKLKKGRKKEVVTENLQLSVIVDKDCRRRWKTRWWKHEKRDEKERLQKSLF